MSEQNYNDVNTGASQPVSDPGATPQGGYPPAPPYDNQQGYGSQQGYGAQPGYGQQQPPYGQPGPGGTYGAGGDPYGQPTAAAGGLSDSAAGALAYVTIIPAIVFLVMAPYNQKPFVKFHAFQCLGLAVFGFCLGIIAIIPVLGWIVWLLGSLAMLVMWIMCIVKAAQGSAFKLPVIGNFAAQQSGYMI